jgi:malic enzyme
LNKGTSFSEEERRAFGLEGLLPHKNKTIEDQERRVSAQIRRHSNSLDKYVALAALHQRNEALFHYVLMNNIEELMPIVYTPTVASVTQTFSHLFQQGRGVWITPDMKGRIAEVLHKALPGPNVKLLVVTDNEAILGIGDQGAGGMAISIGKLALYTAGAGFHPSESLPVSLDFGTDNEQLLGDEQYLGWPQPRLRGEPYYALVEEFVEAVREVCPHALIQWEDFRKDNALRILDTYSGRVLSFNDDIQGTGAVVFAGLVSALAVAETRLEDQRIVLLGAGAGGLGIARHIRAALAEHGVPESEQTRFVAVLDRDGLLVQDRAIRDEYKRELAWSAELAQAEGLAEPADRDLAGVVAKYRPTILLGASGQGGAFTEQVVREMARHTDRPIIFPCSNPTENSEAVPEDLFRWTNGRCLVATGSPFPDVEFEGRTYEIGQGNNVFVFPGLGLGASAVRASAVTDGMIAAASRALSDQVTAEERASGLMFPAVERLRSVSRAVAIAVAQEAVAAGIAEAGIGDVETRIDESIWEPGYDEYVAV